jgi:probable rRNA maturation factor
MKIHFSTVQVRSPQAEPFARRAVRRALATSGPIARGEMNVVWTTRAQLRIMNRRFRRTNRFTDVIAFRHGAESALGPFPLGPRGGEPFGDLYIAVDQARLNARRFGASFSEEIIRLAVHGTLHLLGHTDYTPGPKARMWAVQEPIVQAVLKSASRNPPLSAE